MKTKYLLSICSIFVLFFNTVAHAQKTTENRIIQQDTTLSLVTDSVRALPDSSIIIKKGFFKRVAHYFEEAKKDKSQSKFDISFIGGPSYSVDTKFGIGLIASGLYRIDKEDLSLAPSDVAVYTNFTTSGFLAIGIQNTTIFPNDKYRLNYDMSFRYMPSKFYGIGYESGARDNPTDYDEYYVGLQMDIRRKILPNTYIGFAFSAQNNRAKKFEDVDLKPEGPSNNTAVGAGFILSYDSRDFIPNASKGLFIQYDQMFFPTMLGSKNYFGNINFTARAYQEVWRNALLAFDLNGEFKNGDVPWTMLSKLGGARQMRGYFNGQYRDRKQINSQIELRQKIKGRHGVAAWAGAGNVFETINKFDWSQTLPTYGLGYRWEFKNRVNVRLDYGFGKRQSGFYFNIYESF